MYILKTNTMEIRQYVNISREVDVVASCGRGGSKMKYMYNCIETEVHANGVWKCGQSEY